MMFRIREVFVLLAISLSIIISSTLVFFLVADSPNLLAFSGETFLSGEFWRIFTFPFIHVSFDHLIENVFSLFVITMLAYELGLRGKYFTASFFLSGFIIAVADLFLFPAILIAGASLGIYAVLGSLSIKGSNFIPKYIIIPAFALTALVMPLISMMSSPVLNDIMTKSMMFHLSGFAAGIFLFYAFIKLRSRVKVFTGKHTKEIRPGRRIFSGIRRKKSFLRDL